MLVLFDVDGTRAGGPRATLGGFEGAAGARLGLWIELDLDDRSPT